MMQKFSAEQNIGGIISRGILKVKVIFRCRTKVLDYEKLCLLKQKISRWVIYASQVIDISFKHIIST